MKQSKELVKKKLDREKLFKKQLKERGWTDEDTWSLDWTISKFILPRLKRFKEINTCYPYKQTKKSWDKKIDKMIKAFELASKGAWDMTTGEFKTAQEGIELFAKHYFELWW